MDLSREIEEMKQELVNLADTKDDPLKDSEIYQQSCAIDKKIVEYIKLLMKG